MLTTFRQRDFALLWFGGLVSRMGDWALLYYVYEQTGSTFASGVFTVAWMLPGLLFGPVAGVFADRWSRKWIMVFANLAQVFVVLPLLAARSGNLMWLVYAVMFVMASVWQFIPPAETALLPRLVAWCRRARGRSGHGPRGEVVTSAVITVTAGALALMFLRPDGTARSKNPTSDT
jgi:MFS family permease